MRRRNHRWPMRVILSVFSPFCVAIVACGGTPAAGMDFRPHSATHVADRKAVGAVIVYEGDLETLRVLGGSYLGQIEAQGQRDSYRQGLRYEVQMRAADLGATHVLPVLNSERATFEVVQHTPDQVWVEFTSTGAVATEAPGLRTEHAVAVGTYFLYSVPPGAFERLPEALRPVPWPVPAGLVSSWPSCSSLRSYGRIVLHEGDHYLHRAGLLYIFTPSSGSLRTFGRANPVGCSADAP